MRPTTPGAADPEVLALCHALAELLRLLDEEWHLLYQGERATRREVSLDPAQALALGTIAALKRKLARELGMLLDRGQPA